MSSSARDRLRVAAERQAEALAREAALLEEGREDIRSGRYLSGDEVEAWLEGLDGDQPLPLHDRSSREPSR